MKAKVISKSNEEEILEWKFMVVWLQQEPFQIKVKYASKESLGAIIPFTFGEHGKRKVCNAIAMNRSNTKIQV